MRNPLTFILPPLEPKRSGWHSEAMKWLPLIALFAGCTPVSTNLVSTPAPQNNETPPAQENEAPQKAPMPPGSLEDLLIAEIALNQGDTKTAFERLDKQVKQTGDLRLALRAARIATQLESDVSLQAALQLDGIERSYESLALLARGHLVNEQVDEGAQALNLASEMNPDQVLGFLPRLLAETPDWAGELARALEPTHRDSAAQGIHYLYAVAAGISNEAALKVALDLLEQYPQRASLYNEGARLAQLTGDDALAIGILDRAIEQYPESQTWWLTRTQLFIANEDYEQALQGFKRLIELAPGDTGYQISQGLLAIEVDDLELAEQVGSDLLGSPNTELDAKLILGLVAVNRQELDQARELLTPVQGERFTLARSQLALAYAEAGELEALSEWMDAGRLLRPDLAVDLFLSEAEVLDDAGHPEKILPLLTKAVEQIDDNYQLFYARALYRERDDFNGMEADLLKALELEPGNASIQNALGYTYADANQNLDQALELIGQALAQRPDDPAILDSMGWVHFRLGNLMQALDWLERAYEQLPDAEVGAHLGEALFVDGQTDRALQILRENWDENDPNPILLDTLERLKIEL